MYACVYIYIYIYIYERFAPATGPLSAGIAGNCCQIAC